MQNFLEISMPIATRCSWRQSIRFSRSGPANHPIICRVKYWTVSTQRTLIKEIGQGYIPHPLQRPHPPIIVTAVAPFSKVSPRPLSEAGIQFQQTSDAGLGQKSLAQIVEGCERGGRPANAANWRVAKSVFVAKDAATAKAYATDPDGPYVNYYHHYIPS